MVHERYYKRGQRGGNKPVKKRLAYRIYFFNLTPSIDIIVFLVNKDNPICVSSYIF